MKLHLHKLFQPNCYRAEHPPIFREAISITVYHNGSKPQMNFPFEFEISKDFMRFTINYVKDLGVQIF